MGRMYAEGLLAAGLSTESAIRAHMAGNLYPAPPAYMVPVAVRAVELANRGEWDTPITLPLGVTDSEGNSTATPALVIENFRLEAFIEYDPDEF